MIIHTVTITFGASERLDIERLLQHLGDRVLVAHGVGVEIDHAQRWVEDQPDERH